MSKRGDNLSNKNKRGARRAATERASSGGSKSKKTTLKRKGAPSPLWKWTKRLTIAGGLVALLGALFLAFAVGFAARSLPSFYQLKSSQAGQTIRVLSRDGSEVVEIGPSFGEWLDFQEIPENMRNAMIAVEDKRFYSHYGVDPIRTTGAVVEGFTGARSRVGGTSTISQQLARNLFL
ncbi:MAG: transglycosylase domain-containing protein, partial [Pseudomonadota bacterium]